MFSEPVQHPLDTRLGHVGKARVDMLQKPRLE
jgi:hypothetical protein